MDSAIARKRGRPPKFKQKGRPVTVTLPESTLARLHAIDADRSRAIVKATDAALPLAENSERLPEIVEVAPGVSVLLVGPSRCLREIEWLQMIEVAPSRFLLIIPTGTSIDSLELAVIDQLESVGADEEWERTVLQRLRSLVASLRRGHEITKAELLLIQKTSA